MNKLSKYLLLLPMLALLGCSSDEPFNSTDGQEAEDMVSSMLEPGDLFDYNMRWDELDPVTETTSYGNYGWEINTAPLKFEIMDRFWEDPVYKSRLYYENEKSNVVNINLLLLEDNVSWVMPLELENRENIRITGLWTYTTLAREMKHDGDIPLETDEEFDKDCGWDESPIINSQTFENGANFVEIPEVGIAELEGNCIKIDPYRLEGIDRVIWKTSSPHIVFARIMLEADPTDEELSQGITVARGMVQLYIY